MFRRAQIIAFRNIAFDEMKTLSVNRSANTLIVDVREKEELSIGTIPNSIHIPLSKLEQAFKDPSGQGFLTKTIPDPGKTSLVFYCAAGMRSSKACVIAESYGFDATNYIGGYCEWKDKTIH